jgi:hypothetical protein
LSVLNPHTPRGTISELEAPERLVPLAVDENINATIRRPNAQETTAQMLQIAMCHGLNREVVRVNDEPQRRPQRTVFTGALLGLKFPRSLIPCRGAECVLVVAAFVDARPSTTLTASTLLDMKISLMWLVDLTR